MIRVSKSLTTHRSLLFPGLQFSLLEFVSLENHLQQRDRWNVTFAASCQAKCCFWLTMRTTFLSCQIMPNRKSDPVVKAIPTQLLIETSKFIFRHITSAFHSWADALITAAVWTIKHTDDATLLIKKISLEHKSELFLFKIKLGSKIR